MATGSENEELISQYVDRVKTEEDKDFILAQLNEIDKAFQKVKANMSTLSNAKGFKEVTASLKGLSTATKQQDAIVKSYLNNLRTQLKLEERLAKVRKETPAPSKPSNGNSKPSGDTPAPAGNKPKPGSSAPDKETIASRLAQQQSNAETKRALELEKAAANSIEESRARIKVLTAEKIKLNLATEEGRQRLEELNAEIDKEGDFIEATADKYTKRKLNIGNYANSFSGAVDVLRESLDEIRAKLNDPTLEGKQLEKLQKEEMLLTQLTDKLNRSFGSTKGEMRALQDAANQVGINFGTTSEIFLQFSANVGEAKDQIGDIQGIINQNASDTKFLDTAVASVNALAGAYGAAQGALALFENDSEEMQKTMAKLQALLTIINGLQAVQNALTDESAAMQGILAAKTALLNAARTVEVALFTRSAAAAQVSAVANAEVAVAAEAAAIAQVENATASQAMVVAQGEVAVSASGAAVALEGEAAAATIATTSTRGFMTALAATGIGAAIAAFVAGVVLLVSKVNEWVSSNTRAIDKQNDLADAVTATNEAIITQTNTWSRAEQAGKRFLQNQIDFSSAAGEGAVRQFALKKQLAMEEKKLAEEQINSLGATNAQQAQLLTSIQNLQARKVIVSQLLQKAITAGDETAMEANNKVLESYDKQMQGLESLYNAGEEARQTAYQADKDFAQLQIEEQKFQADERRKLVLESTQIEVGLIQAKNDAILNDDRASLDQRLAAIRANADAQRRAIGAEKNDVLANPGASPVDRSLAIKKAAAEEQALTIQINETIAKEKESFRLRDLAAQQEALRISKELNIDTNKEIADNQVFTLDQRLQALTTYATAQKEIADAEYKLKLQQAGISDEEIKALSENAAYQVKSKRITDDELFAMQKAYESEVLRLGVDTQTAITSVLQSEIGKRQGVLDKNLQDLELYFTKTNVAASQAYAEEVITLNNSLAAGEVTRQKYNARRAAIDKAYTAKAIGNTVSLLEDQLALLASAGEKEIKVREQVEDLKQQLAEATTEEEKKALASAIAIGGSELKNAEDNVARKLALEEQLAAKRRELSEQLVAELQSNEEGLAEMQKQLAMEVYDTIVTFLDARFDQETALVEAQMEQTEEKRLKERDAVEQAIVNEDEKATELARIEAIAASKKDQLDNRRREIEYNRAKFNKAAQAAVVIADNIQAVAKLTASAAQAKAQALLLAANPFTAGYAPIAFASAAAIGAQIPITIALGAAQLGKILATPLPKYYKGKGPGDNYEGMAVVGDGGRSELIMRANGTRELTPDRPTLTYVGKDDIILPDARKALEMAAMEQTDMAALGRGSAAAGHPDQTALIAGINRMRNDVVYAIKNQPQPIIKGRNIIREWVRSGYSWSRFVGGQGD